MIEFCFIQMPYVEISTYYMPEQNIKRVTVSVLKRVARKGPIPLQTE